MNYSETIDFLFNSLTSFQQVGAAAYKPGLERIESFCKALGEPQNRYLTIHVAGTNGKGSVSHMLTAVLGCAGYKVGLFTSPHMLDFRERIRVDSQMISEGEVVDFVAQNRGAIDELGLSFFEMTAAMAFSHFAKERVDVAIIETGLGGRLDATNVVMPHLSVITNISKDHTQFLGNSIEEIAAEKAGIIKAGRPVVVGESNSHYNALFERVATSKSSDIFFADRLFKVVEQRAHEEYQCFKIEESSSGTISDYQLDLMGEYQSRNVVTLMAAIQTVNALGKLSVSDDACRCGLKEVQRITHLLGRWQKLQENPLVICDSGHNNSGIEQVTQQIANTPHDKLICVMAFTKERDLDDVLPLLPRSGHYIFTEINSPRRMGVGDIVEKANSLSISCETAADFAAAYARAKELSCDEDLVFIGGSSYLVAEALEHATLGTQAEK